MRIVPDLTALGKGVNGVVAGAGAIVGREDLMNILLFKDDTWNRHNRVSHFGIFNANPFCGVTGIAYLKMIATGEPTRKANENARMLRDGMQRKMDERGIKGCVYDSGFSVLHVYYGNCNLRGQCDRTVCLNANKVNPPDLGEALYINLTLNGVKAPSRGYDLLVSAVHTKDDIDRTMEAFGTSLDTMVNENKLPK